MVRKKRIWYEGACYHVMGRGNRRCSIFNDQDDYRIFLKLLQTVKKRCPFTLYAYCLMTNHFHLELATENIPIWKIMQPVMSSYTRIFNIKNKVDGHLFDSRYTSCLIENEAYFLEVSRYIHLNPVKASMVEEPLSYEYSSYRTYVTNEEEKSIVDTSRVFSYFLNNPREQYRLFVEEKISHSEQESQIQKDMKENEMWLPY